MNRIVEKTDLSENVVRMVLEAPAIARKRKAGQFVVLIMDEKGERIPLTIVDSDAQQGTITIDGIELGRADPTALRARLAEMMQKRGGEVFYARPEFCTDNGAMIAYAGMVRLKAKGEAGLGVTVRPRWPLSELPAA